MAFNAETIWYSSSRSTTINSHSKFHRNCLTTHYFIHFIWQSFTICKPHKIHSMKFEQSHREECFHLVVKVCKLLCDMNCIGGGGSSSGCTVYISTLFSFNSLCLSLSYAIAYPMRDIMNFPVINTCHPGICVREMRDVVM